MTRQPAARPVIIANCSGFFGDRGSALAEVVRGGPVDIVTGDYLAEVTMLVLAKTQLKDPSSGYAASFLHQLKPVLAEIAAKGIKIVVNAGGLNPAAMAAAVRGLCAEAGVALRVAHIEGDDIMPRLDSLQAQGEALPHLDTGEPLSNWSGKPLTANAYLGGWGVARALGEGADIVICPRVTDASVVVGAAAWWHEWKKDDWNALAGAVAAGHIIECGTQATGGNYSGFAQIDDLERPGFPIAEIAADGSSIITKHPGTGGAVTVGTVTAQLLYEIQGLDYLNPDVSTRLDTIALADVGPDRVAVTGVEGAPPPSTTKVAITAIGGYQNSAAFVLTGLDRDGKAALVERAIRRRLEGRPGIDELRFQHIGASAADPQDQLAATSLLQVAVRGEEAAVGRGFFNMIVELALASYPGLFTIKGDSRTAKSFGIYWPALISQTLLDHRVVHDDGRSETIGLPPAFGDGSDRSSASVDAGDDWGDLVSAPLGHAFDARSGDKGGNGNVGIWARNDAGYRWLAGKLTVDRFKALVPEAASLEVRRYLLPNLFAVNFVIVGLLDGGATETLRFDPQAKALGEYVRAKVMNIPSTLLRR